MKLTTALQILYTEYRNQFERGQKCIVTHIVGDMTPLKAIAIPCYKRPGAAGVCQSSSTDFRSSDLVGSLRILHTYKFAVIIALV